MIDRYIVRFFLFLCLLAGGVIYFQSQRYLDCDDIQISILNEEAIAGEVVGFSCNFPDADNYEWKFDFEKEEVSQDQINHIFKTAGKYLVALTVNGQCRVSTELLVKPLEIKVDSTNYPEFRAPLYVHVGQPVRFIDKSKGATSWEWRFGESYGTVDSKKKHPYYTYRTSGEKQVTLVIDGKLEFVTRKTITVLPAVEKKPDPVAIATIAPPTEPVVQDEPVETSAMPSVPPIQAVENVYQVEEISENELIELLKLISEDQKKPEALLSYTCGKFDIPVRVNGLRMTLGDLCEKIHNRRIRIDKIEIVRNGQTNCIKFLNIEMKKGIFTKIFK